VTKTKRPDKTRQAGRLGEKVRQLRLASHKSLGDLAAAVDTSRSFLSQIEQGKTSPSLMTLKSIAAALGVTVGSLIDEPPPADQAAAVVKMDARPRIEQLQAGVVIEALTYRDMHKTMQPMILRLAAGASSGQNGYVHTGQEFGIVLQGDLQVDIDGVRHHLREGDSIYFDASRPHRFTNDSEGETVAVWVVTPATF